ncbi:MAG: phosphoribosyltransferase family protein [Cloacibacillus evryensis]
MPCGELDITLYRDDLTTLSEQPIVHSTRMLRRHRGKHIFLVDDVLFTGRTVRARLRPLSTSDARR